MLLCPSKLHHNLADGPIVFHSISLKRPARLGALCEQRSQLSCGYRSCQSEDGSFKVSGDVQSPLALAEPIVTGDPLRKHQR